VVSCTRVVINLAVSDLNTCCLLKPFVNMPSADVEAKSYLALAPYFLGIFLRPTGIDFDATCFSP
jgi:hypothetical protein